MQIVKKSNYNVDDTSKYHFTDNDGLSPFFQPQIRNWFVQICFALQYLHKKSIIHRDVKAQVVFSDHTQWSVVSELVQKLTKKVGLSSFALKKALS